MHSLKECSIKTLAYNLNQIHDIKKEYADSQKKTLEKITTKQGNYINHLMMNHGLTFRWLLENISKDEASRLIDKLITLKDVEDKHRDADEIAKKYAGKDPKKVEVTEK